MLSSIIAHAGHPGATENPVVHGLSHWLVAVPVVTVVVLVLLTAILWSLGKPLRKTEKTDTE